LLLDQLALKLDKTFEVYAGSGCHKPLGGHLHFSGLALDVVFLAVLDRFITIPLNEVSKTQLRVDLYGYGRLSAADAVKPHGGFEYRSPPSWICMPELVKGVISLAWVLAQAQKHGCLEQFQTWDDFFEYPRKGHAKHIKKFTSVLSNLKQRNIKLETIEVLKAWDKRDLLPPIKKPVKKTRKKPTPAEVSPVSSSPQPLPVAWVLDWALGDAYMPAIVECVGELFSSIALRIVGAHQSRSPRKVVFLPAGWRVTLLASETLLFRNGICCGLSDCRGLCGKMWLWQLRWFERSLVL
jgi:Phage phiEco32-like COOH.NH2 ligase-type 2